MIPKTGRQIAGVVRLNNDDYLFTISVPAASARAGWFAPLNETNAILMRATWLELDYYTVAGRLPENLTYNPASLVRR